MISVFRLRKLPGMCLQHFDVVGWVAGRASGLSKTEWCGAGMVICLGRGADFAYGPADATATLSLASVKSRLVLVPAYLGNLGGQSPEGRKMCMCVCMCVCVCVCVRACMHAYVV